MEVEYMLKKEKGVRLLQKDPDLYYHKYGHTEGCLAFVWDQWTSFEDLLDYNTTMSKKSPRAPDLFAYLTHLTELGWIETRILTPKEIQEKVTQEIVDVYDNINIISGSCENKIIDKDNVNHPQHYTFSQDNTYEVIKVIEAWDLDFRLANVVKYVARAPHKGKAFEDLKKALWYIARYMKTEFPEEYRHDYSKLMKTLEMDGDKNVK